MTSSCILVCTCHHHRVLSMFQSSWCCSSRIVWTMTCLLYWQMLHTFIYVSCFGRLGMSQRLLIGIMVETLGRDARPHSRHCQEFERRCCCGCKKGLTDRRTWSAIQLQLWYVLASSNNFHCDRLFVSFVIKNRGWQRWQYQLIAMVILKNRCCFASSSFCVACLSVITVLGLWPSKDDLLSTWSYMYAISSLSSGHYFTSHIQYSYISLP